jgi:hypothetical protein
MTETTAQRPVARRRARAAADENQDPMDVGPARSSGTSPAGVDLSATPTAPEPPTETSGASAGSNAPQTQLPALQPRQNSQLTVTLNVRVSPSIGDLVARVIADTGLSKRAIVEHALLTTYG